MIERARTKAQLDKIQSSILMIDMHKSTIEGTALDLSVVETLRASGDALRQMGATYQGLHAVEDLVSTIEESMQVCTTPKRYPCCLRETVSLCCILNLCVYVCLCAECLGHHLCAVVWKREWSGQQHGCLLRSCRRR